MTILHLTASAAPHKGGVETHLAAVVKLQRQAGHRVTVLTKPQPHTKVATWQFCWTHLDDFLKADVIHVHDVFWWILPLLPFLWWHHKKIITTFHGWEGQYPVRWQAKLQRLVYNHLSTKAVHVGAWIQEFYWDKPDAVVYGGVEVVPVGKPDFLSYNKQLKIVFVGRLVVENEIEKYLKLIENLKKTLTQKITLTWVGDGNYREQCQAVGEVVGMVDQPLAFLKSADLVFASSYLSILEAQSLGKIVVALYSHPLKLRYLETYPGFAAMVVGSDPSLVSEQLSVVLADQSRCRELQHQALQTAKQYSWQKVAQLYEQLAS